MEEVEISVKNERKLHTVVMEVSSSDNQQKIFLQLK